MGAFAELETVFYQGVTTQFPHSHLFLDLFYRERSPHHAASARCFLLWGIGWAAWELGIGRKIDRSRCTGIVPGAQRGRGAGGAIPPPHPAASPVYERVYTLSALKGGFDGLATAPRTVPASRGLLRQGRHRARGRRDARPGGHRPR